MTFEDIIILEDHQEMNDNNENITFDDVRHILYLKIMFRLAQVNLQEKIKLVVSKHHEIKK